MSAHQRYGATAAPVGHSWKSSFSKSGAHKSHNKRDSPFVCPLLSTVDRKQRTLFCLIESTGGHCAPHLRCIWLDGAVPDKNANTVDKSYIIGCQREKISMLKNVHSNSSVKAYRMHVTGHLVDRSRLQVKCRQQKT